LAGGQHLWVNTRQCKCLLILGGVDLQRWTQCALEHPHSLALPRSNPAKFSSGLEDDLAWGGVVSQSCAPQAAFLGEKEDGSGNPDERGDTWAWAVGLPSSVVPGRPPGNRGWHGESGRK
jgi:hypothetical protein